MNRFNIWVGPIIDGHVTTVATWYLLGGPCHGEYIVGPPFDEIVFDGVHRYTLLAPVSDRHGDQWVYVHNISRETIKSGEDE